MADKQTLAVVQEILLKSRIKFTTGTEAEWTEANPVLLDGEYGLVRGTSPLKYKVGDGTKTWSALGWANVTSLAQLMADASHRLVTDAQITGWNEKADVFTFNYNAYLHPPTGGLNPQGQVAKNIVAAINANKKCVVVAQNVTVQEIEDSVSGFVFHHRGFRIGPLPDKSILSHGFGRQRSHGIPRYCFHHVQVRRHRDDGGSPLHRAYRHGRCPARIQHGESSDG